MKIQRIRLAAYGPFTDEIIDLFPDSQRSDGGSDFHLLFGPNEAGKSSALKAIRHMLFGIPAREPVNFVHAYPSLRVGARLVNGSGDQIEFVRRKGRAKTLRGPDDETVLDDDALAPFLGGVSAEVFEQMFAIGHEDLIQGGEEIISGQGSVGEALFAAGAGLIRLQTVQQALEQDCGALFKPSGTAPAINQAIKAIKQARREQKAALLLPKTWIDHHRALGDAEQRMQTVKADLVGRKQAKARLERIQAALPLIVRKKEIDAGLEAYRDVPELAADFGEQRRDADKELRLADREMARLQADIADVGRAMAALPDHAALLESAATVESLQQSLGEFRKAQKDRPALDGRMRTLTKQAADTLAAVAADLTAPAARDPKLPPSTVAEIQQLEKAYERLSAQHDAAAEQQRQRSTRLRRLREQRRAMPVPVDVTCLENALQAAQEAGPIDRQRADLRTANQRIEAELEAALGRQTLWQGTLSAIDRLPLPSRETIERFAAEADALERRCDRFREEAAATDREIDQTRADLQAIDLAQEVPTEADLNHARSLRDRGWALIRQQLDTGSVSAEASREVTAQIDPDADLPGAFETSMQRADHIADRLRREAGQVSQKGLLEARRAKLEKARAAAAAALEAAEAEFGRLQAAWRQAWAPADIDPQTPREMQSWRSGMTALRDKLADLRVRKGQAQDLADQMAALTADLVQAFAAAGAPQDPVTSLHRLVQAARSTIAAHTERQAHIAAADKELIRLKAESGEGAALVAELEARHAQWRADWQAGLGKLGIRPDATPTEAIAVIDSIRGIVGKTEEAEVLRKRISGIDRDSTDFESRVDALVGALAPDLAAEPRDRAAELINGRLTQARKDETRRANLAERLAAGQKALAAAEKRRFACQATIETLCQAAGCEGAEALAEAEKRARARTALINEFDDIARQLRSLSAGAPVQSFMDEAAGVDADRIVPDLQDLDLATQALEAERSALDQQIGALTAQLEQMDGRSAAAAHAEEAERLLAGLESDVEQYARLKIASVILARTVEQYREKHQGPLIARASELFAQMTLGGFDRLRADYDDKGNPVLVGIRAGGGAAVHVAGMSDGTADQLYLALRLASLEQYLEHNEPLPFVVDDILLRFDDERSQATLGVLAGLAEKTQVLFFTHHRHLVELAERSKAPRLGFRLHRLGDV